MKAPSPCSIGDAQAEERGVADLRRAPPVDARGPAGSASRSPVEPSSARRSRPCPTAWCRRRPAGRSAGRRTAVLAQPVPVAVGEPGRAAIVPVSCAGPEAEHVSPRRSSSACCVKTRASSMMQALPAALSVAASPGQESWCPPTRMKSSLGSSGAGMLADRDLHRPPAVLDVRAEPDPRPGPSSHSSRSFRPAVRAMPMHGMRRHLGRCSSPASDCPTPASPSRTAPPRSPAWPQFIMTRADRAAMPGDALLLVPRRRVGQLGQRDLAARRPCPRTRRRRRSRRRPAAPPMPSAGVSRLCPSVLAWIAISTRTSDPELGRLGEAHQARQLVDRRRRRRRRAARRRCTRPCGGRSRSRRAATGSSGAMCSTWARTLSAEARREGPPRPFQSLPRNLVPMHRPKARLHWAGR